jgi:hypothetical protein
VLRATSVGQSLLEHFCAAKAELRKMDLRVLPLDDDDRGVRSTFLKLYVHAQRGTRYNDFSTS